MTFPAIRLLKLGHSPQYNLHLRNRCRKMYQLFKFDCFKLSFSFLLIVYREVNQSYRKSNEISRNISLIVSEHERQNGSNFRFGHLLTCIYNILKFLPEQNVFQNF